MKVKLVKSTNSKKFIYGKHIDLFDIDYTQDLDSIKEDIESILNLIISQRSLYNIFQSLMLDKNKIRVFSGSNHLDIIEDGKGSLGWLIVVVEKNNGYTE